MDYFSKFLRSNTQPQPPNAQQDHVAEFINSWIQVKTTLEHPDERQLAKGIKTTEVPSHLQSILDALVWESTRTEDGGTGACLEYLLKNDVLGHLVRLSEADRPFGIQAEVLRSVQNMVVLLDEQFLVHSAVHRAVLRLLRNCAGDDLQDQLDSRKILGAAGTSTRSEPSEYEEDLVNLLCILCGRIRSYRELLMIFFHDKNWYRSEPLFSIEEENEDDFDEEEEEEEPETERSASPTPSQATLKSAPTSTSTGSKKSEYEFLLFNYLLRFVHREGEIGEFARGGLLFLMDVAMSPGDPIHTLVGDEKLTQGADPITDAALALAEYVLDGDFSEVLGAGLGAVYSLLPTKLEFRPQHQRTTKEENLGTGMIIGGTGPETEDEKDYEEFARERSKAIGIGDPSSPDFRSKLDHFLKLLEFLQDVFRRNVVPVPEPEPEPGSGRKVSPSTLVGTSIAQSILASVQRIFFENVLYPSVLECSDQDGSAVAVMSYIEIMVRTLEVDGPLANLLVEFLMSEDNEEDKGMQQRTLQEVLTLDSGSDIKSLSLPPQSSSSKSNVENRADKHRRRKSSAMVLLEMEAPESNRPSDYFTTMGRFTLKDLILTNMKSPNQATATVAVQLLQTMLLRYPKLSMERLLVVVKDPWATSFPEPGWVDTFSLGDAERGFSGEDDDDTDDDEEFVYPGAEEEPKPFSSVFVQPETTYSTHERELGLYLALVSRVDPSHSEDVFSTGYDYYLRDALLSIQDQPAYQFPLSTEERAGLKHRLNANDPILSLVLESLRKFLSNTPEFNIALTGLLAVLAQNPDRSLASWLTFGTNDVSHQEDPPLEDLTSDGDDRSIDFVINEKLSLGETTLPASSMDEKSRPIVHLIFQGLVNQIERYRVIVDDFDRFLRERRRGLLFNENLTDALNLALEVGEDGNTGGGIGPNSSPVEMVQQQQKQSSITSAASSLYSWMTPKKAKSVKPASERPSTPGRIGGDKNATLAASPFGSHYKQTNSISVEPFVASVPSTGPWTPAKAMKFNLEEEDVFGSTWNTGKPIHHRKQSSLEMAYSGEPVDEKPVAMVTLSRLLDNVVVLEESIKELAAIIQARRSLGIDGVRYL